MAKYNYLLSFSSVMFSPNPGQIQVFISQNRDIESWYLAFPGTYILKCDKALAELVGQFTEIFSSSPFILTWIPAGCATGSLPPAVWQWLNQQQNTSLPGQ